VPERGGCDVIRVALRRTVFFWKRGEEGSDSSQERVFTDYVRALSENAEPDADLVRAVEKALRAALRSELRRRGLWESPPGWLGVYGWDRWETTGGGALEELLAECYVFIFVDRLRGLQAQLRVKSNIDGLVFLDIRHFLHERQKAHDPLGSQVFEVLRSAVRGAVEAGELRVLSGDPRIRNDTVLAFGTLEEPPAAAISRDLREIVAAWNDDLLPDLVTLRGRHQEEIVLRLRERLAGLRQRGIPVFRFKDLVDPMKADVRARWAAVLERREGEVVVERETDGEARGTPLVFPDTAVEERQLFRWLVGCVLDGIERLDVNDKTRRYLLTLWQFHRVRAVETPAAGLGLAGEDESPSRRKLAELLRIPRERLSGLYEILGRLLEECRAAALSPVRPGEVRT
jgi:hypothetical protein